MKKEDIKKQKKITESQVKPIALKALMVCIFIVFILLIFRLFWLQFIKGPSLKENATKQQTINKIISPKRGSIYDTNGKSLAISAQVDTVTINPSKIKAKDKERIAQALSEIFTLDYVETLAKVNSTSPSETIIKKVEQDKINTLKQWMKDNDISVGINIDADTKRYYPYNNLASNLIGFTGTDNQGLDGLELYWDSTLAGTAGKIVTSGDVHNDEISSEAQQYIEAENGSNLYLTIDVQIQLIVEKYLAEAAKKDYCEGASAIIMKPSTGEILAMASYPDYNLNTPFEPNEASLEGWDKLTSAEKSAKLEKMWRNKVVSDTYEPGSTFKVLMTAIALEENITETDISKDFSCVGYENVADRKIRCWNSASHGYLTLRQALANSCNPSFIQLGKRIGVETLYKYYEAFGLFTHTNIATSGEASSLFFNKSDIGPTELATMSFGQRFNITPLQLITAISSIANDGILVQPKIVNQIENSNTGNITTIETNDIRQVVSSDTAAQVLSMMQSVVTDGTGRTGEVKGFSIGGKTGTSEPSPGKEEEGYVVSYVSVAPSINPEIVALVVFYNPGGNNPQGSQIAGPAMSKILSEVLPYLGITSDEVDTVSSTSTYKAVPNITNKTVTEAKKTLENLGFTTSISITGDANTLLVTNQVPAAGTYLPSDSKIFLYTEENTVRTSVNVPDLTGLTLAQATSLLKEKNLNLSAKGTGTVTEQSIPARTSVEEGTVINITLK